METPQAIVFLETRCKVLDAVILQVGQNKAEIQKKRRTDETGLK